MARFYTLLFTWRDASKLFIVLRLNKVCCTIFHVHARTPQVALQIRWSSHAWKDIIGGIGVDVIAYDSGTLCCN